MLKFLKWVKVGFWGSCVLAATLLAGYFAAMQQATLPTWQQIIEIDEINYSQPSKTQNAARKSRASAIKIKSHSLRMWGGSALTSGTYFIAKGRPYVATVYHGIQGPCWLISITHADHSYSCKKYIKIDKENDYILMELESFIPDRTPIRIPQDLPRGSEWKSSYSILTHIVYTGYPNTIGPLTLRGDVVGYSREEYLYVFSHAYGGASGSGVFSENGKYIGYVVAIDVGTTEYGVDVLENIVIVAPSYNIDWGAVLN